MGSADDGVNGPAPDAGAGGNGRGGYGRGGYGHGGYGRGGPERSPWAAPAWDRDASSGPGERPVPGGEGSTGTSGPAAPVPAAEVPAAQVPAAQPSDARGSTGEPPTQPAPAGYPQGSYPQGPYPPGPYPPGPAGHPHGPSPQGVYPPPPYGPSPYGPGGFPPPYPPPAVEGPPKRTHRWGLGAYVVVEAVFLLTSFLVALVFGDLLTSSAGALAVALVVPTLLAAGTALLITRLRGNGPRIDLGLQWSWRDVGIGLAFGFGGLVITIPASILYVAIAGSETTSAVGEEFGDIRSGPLMAAVVFVIVVFVAPLCEEIVYRGLLWGAVERLGARRWWALAITTVVFALAHFEFTRTPLLLVVAIPIALARLYTGRLVAGVVAHGVNNLLPAAALVMMLLGVLPGT